MLLNVIPYPADTDKDRLSLTTEFHMSDVNSIFNALAHAFVGTLIDGKELPFLKALDRDRLDATLESLHEVDRYLNHIHANRGRLDDEKWSIALLRAGAYAGEVIRHTAPVGEFEWVDYDDYMPSHPDLLPHIPERTSATCAFLVHRTGAISAPLNKVADLIEDGPPNSVHYFAYCELRRFGSLAAPGPH